MHLINNTPYDTRALRRAVVAGYRIYCDNVPAGRSRWAWERVDVYVVLRGAVVKRAASNVRASVTVRVQAPTGDEWHEALRDVAEPRSLTAWTVVVATAVALGLDWGTELARMGPSTFPASRRLARFVPLAVKEPPAPRDVIAERHARVVELERAWTRKRKLADTKVRQYRKRRRYYEKRMTARTTEGA